MNNDLEQLSEERLKYLVSAIKLEPCDYHDVYDNIPHGEIAALARIALSVKQAAPAGYLENGKGFMYEPRHKDLIKNPTPVYTTPQPAHAEQANSPVIPDGWKLVPIELTVEMLDAGCAAFGIYDVYRDMLAAAPKPESE